MKLLNKMLLINWHYINKQVIEFENTNFLTGKNGAGKSTILDALQLLLLGDTRGTFFNKAANEKAGRSLEGYLKGEIGDDGDVGYKYLRNGAFTTYIVGEFYDTQERRYFCLGVCFDVDKEIKMGNNFFFINSKIPENEFIDDNNTPIQMKDLKPFLISKFGIKKFEIYSSNKQYQDAMRGKLGSLNQKFFNLFKKAVTFTPIDDIEKFIVEYVCDVKNKIDITSMQENIRQYNALSKQVRLINEKVILLDDIKSSYTNYINELEKEKQEKYLINKSQEQIIIEKIEKLNQDLENNKNLQKQKEEENAKIDSIINDLKGQIDELKEIRAKSDVNIKIDNINKNIKEINLKLSDIYVQEEKTIKSFRNHSLIWNANITQTEKIGYYISEIANKNINELVDLIKYLNNINEQNFENLDIEAVKQLKEKVGYIISLGNNIFFNTEKEYNNNAKIKQELEKDIQKLEKGMTPYEESLINFKEEIEHKLNIKTYILADLLEIKNPKWQNAIEGYLNTQKKYIIIEPQFFEKASEIYRALAKENEKMHSFGLIDVEKVRKENNVRANNSLAEEIITQNEYARDYIDYLLGRVIKCESIQELRENKISITPDCMLYQGYVLRKINPKNYKYPIIGKEALKRQKEIKLEELNNIQHIMEEQEIIIQISKNLKEMPNYSDDDVQNFMGYIENSKAKTNLQTQKEELQKELDSIDMFWINNINNEIKEKENIQSQKEDEKSKNSQQIGKCKKVIEDMINVELPKANEELETNKNNMLMLNYSNEWVENVGNEVYEKAKLKRTNIQIFDFYSNKSRQTLKRINDKKDELIAKRSNYINKYQLPYNIMDDNNSEFDEELRKLKEIELPEYQKEIEDSKEKAYEQFRIEFLDKLKSNIEEVKSQIKSLNNALSDYYFGTDTYIFKLTPKKDYKRFYDMIMDDMLIENWAIGRENFYQKYAQEVKELFDKITTSDINNSEISTEEYEKNIKEYTDYKTYLNFDLVVKDKNGNEQRLSKTLLKKSGGETQTPFYIAILASFAQVYRINERANTLRLIVFDEAFSKMDSERIEQSIKLLKRIEFQSIFAAPPDKLQDIQELVDSTLLVLNPEEHNIVVKKYAKKQDFTI